MLAECCTYGKQLIGAGHSNHGTAVTQMSQAALLVWRTRELALEREQLEELAATSTESSGSEQADPRLGWKRAEQQKAFSKLEEFKMQHGDMDIKHCNSLSIDRLRQAAVDGVHVLCADLEATAPSGAAGLDQASTELVFLAVPPPGCCCRGCTNLAGK